MKNVTRFFSIAFVLVTLVLFGQLTAKAQSSDVQAYSGEFGEKNRIEIIYSAETKKLGVLIKDQDGSLTAGYILQNVENARGTFYLNNANKFGKTNDSELITLKLGKFRENSVSVRINNKPAGEFQRDYSGSLEMARPPYGYCNGVCVPANPENYNWNYCFWCCFNNPGQC